MGVRPTVALLCVALAVVVAHGAAAPLKLSSDRKNIDPAQHLVALDPRWTVQLETAPAAPAGFDSRTAYVPIKGGELLAIDADSGVMRWRAPLATAVTPATGDGFVFVAMDNRIAALDETTGAAAWKTDLVGPFAALSFDAGMLIATSAAGDLLMIRGENGETLWRRAIGTPLAAPPSSAGDRLYAGLDDGRVVALDRDSGETRWTYETGDPITGVLALDDQVIIGTRGNQVYSLALDRPRLRWQWRVGGDVRGAAIADEQRIYFVALDNVLRAVDRGTGNLRWTRALPSRPAGGPIKTGDVVIVPTVSADIGAYSADSGAPAFTIKAGGELRSVPFVRDTARPTAPRLISVSTNGIAQGFAARYEPASAAFSEIPGAPKVGG